MMKNFHEILIITCSLLKCQTNITRINTIPFHNDLFLKADIQERKWRFGMRFCYFRMHLKLFLFRLLIEIDDQ